MTRRSYAQLLTQRTQRLARHEELAQHLPELVIVGTAPGSLERYLGASLGVAARLADELASEGLAWHSIAEIRDGLLLAIEADAGRSLEKLYLLAELEPRELYDRLRNALEAMVRSGLVERSGVDEDPREGELVYRIARQTA